MRFLLLFLFVVPVFGQDDDSEHRVWHFWRNECAGCHGQDGKGVDAIKSPAIAGLPDYYVMQQIRKYRLGLRGAEKSEENVYFMHREAEALGDELFKDLARIISGMEPHRTLHSTIGDIERGKRLYQKHCTDCHGPAAAGDAAKEAPPLHGFQDWYLVEQIERFKRGRRKSDPLNLESVKMHLMARSLWRRSDINALAAFITSNLDGQTDADP
ncbi:MAG: cytochrome c oxidase subunit 2 [Verrucomicrobiales bacterium]|jgi:cytochrome c oxidase subunit 2